MNGADHTPIIGGLSVLLVLAGGFAVFRMLDGSAFTRPSFTAASYQPSYTPSYQPPYNSSPGQPMTQPEESRLQEDIEEKPKPIDLSDKGEVQVKPNEETLKPQEQQPSGVDAAAPPTEEQPGIGGIDAPPPVE